MPENKEKQTLSHTMQLRLGDDHLKALDELIALGYAPTRPWVIRQAIVREKARLDFERSQK